MPSKRGKRMAFMDDELSAIYDRTSGYCHICRKKLAFSNYGRFGRLGAWEIDHSRAKARGGSDHFVNLYAACIDCNRRKGAGTTRTARRQHGRRRAPLSRSQRATAKQWNAVAGGIVGWGIGALAGPLGMVVGGMLGARFGHDADPDDEGME